MRKQILVILLISVFFLFIVSSVHATVSVESTIDDKIHVVINLENLDATLYADAKANPIFTGSAIAQIIVQNLEDQDRGNVAYDFQANAYDDSSRAIIVSFDLGDTDVITSTTNRTSLRQSYSVITDWRKFQANLTNSVSIDFAAYFAEPVQKWQLIDYTDSTGKVHAAYYYETSEIAQLGKMSFRFILPSAATNVQVKQDTITYDVPLGFEDVFISSPFLILAVIIIIVVIALVYRVIR